MQTSHLKVTIPFSGQQDSSGVQKAKRSQRAAAPRGKRSTVGAAARCDLLIFAFISR
jgi:hypothetical protein